MPSRYPIILLPAAQLPRCASEHFLLSFNVGTMILVVAELVSVVEIKRCTCPDNKGKAANSTKSLILVTDLHMTWARQDLRQLKRMRMYFVATFDSMSSGIYHGEVSSVSGVIFSERTHSCRVLCRRRTMPA